MKAIITVIATASLFSMTACNTSALKEKEAELVVRQHTIDSMNITLAKKQVIDSMNEVNRYQYTFAQPVNTKPVVSYATAAPRRSPVRKSSVKRYTAYNESAPVYNEPAYSAPAATPAVYHEPVQQQKRGWSAKAKGAVIGAGTGAAAGAIINGRNRLAGAIIGGVLGAGAGTGIGAILDHKNGR